MGPPPDGVLVATPRTVSIPEDATGRPASLPIRGVHALAGPPRARPVGAGGAAHPAVPRPAAAARRETVGGAAPAGDLRSRLGGRGGLRRRPVPGGPDAAAHARRARRARVHPHGVPPRLPVRVPGRSRRRTTGRTSRASRESRRPPRRAAARRGRSDGGRARSLSSIPRRPTRRAGTPPRSCTLSARRRPCGGSTAGRATPGPGRTCATAGGTSRARGRCHSSRPRRARPRGPRSRACVSSAPGVS